jgi:hypothetical protein
LLQCPRTDVNCTDVRMTTPLHWYAWCEQEPPGGGKGSAVSPSSGCDGVSLSVEKMMVVLFACRAAVCNRPDVCKALAQRGAKPAFRDINGMTPLHYATTKGIVAIGGEVGLRVCLFGGVVSYSGGDSLGHTECAAILQRLTNTGGASRPLPDTPLLAVATEAATLRPESGRAASGVCVCACASPPPLGQVGPHPPLPTHRLNLICVQAGQGRCRCMPGDRGYGGGTGAASVKL